MFTLFMLLSIIAILLITYACRKKSILRVSLILLLAVTVTLFAGCKASEDGESTDKPETVETTETRTEGTEKTEEKEPEVKKSPIYDKFNVYDVADYDETRLKELEIYDVSSSENSFKFVLEAKEDDVSINLTYLNWKDNEYVEKELITKFISTMKKGEACVICVDVYEPVSRVGLQCQFEREFYRACPVLNSKDGKPILESIDDRLGPKFYMYGEMYPVTVSSPDSLSEALEVLSENEDFIGPRSKIIEVFGLSKPVYLGIGDYNQILSVWIDMEHFDTRVTGEKTNLFDGLKAKIYEADGAVVLSCDYYEVGDTWIFRDGRVTEYHPDGDSSVTFRLDEDGKLKYTRFSERFTGRVHQDESASLEVAVSRDEFLRETGSVSIDTNGKVELTPEKTFTVSDVYELDDIFTEYRESDNFKHKYPYCTSVEDILTANRKLEDLRNIAESENDIRYKWIVSFLSGDAETCASMTIGDPLYSSDDKETAERLMLDELQDLFAGISIGNYSVEKATDEHKNEYLQFDFEIIASNVEIFPVGDYSATVSKWGTFNSPGVYFTRRAGKVTIEDEDERFFADKMFDSWYGETAYPEANSHSPSLVLFYLYEHANGMEVKGLTRLTPAQLDEIAAEVYAEGFGVDYWPFDYYEGENGEDPYYMVRGMGGVVEYRDLISRMENGNIITYEVVYYAEPMKLIPAKTFRYTVEKTDSVYGFRLTGVEEIASTGLEIFTQGM